MIRNENLASLIVDVAVVVVVVAVVAVVDVLSGLMHPAFINKKGAFQKR